MGPGEIKLTHREMKALKRIRKNIIPLSQDTVKEYDYLFSLDLVRTTISDKYSKIVIDESECDNAIQITTLGKQVFLHKRAYFWAELRAWVTLAIAILAFALSVFCTCLKFALLELCSGFLSPGF